MRRKEDHNLGMAHMVSQKMSLNPTVPYLPNKLMQVLWLKCTFSFIWWFTGPFGNRFDCDNLDCIKGRMFSVTLYFQA